MITLIALGAFAFVVSALAARFLSSPLARVVRLDTIDVPNDRSLHSTPTPRAGGLAIAVGMASGLIAFGLAGNPIPGWLASTLACSAVIGLLSFVDDRRGLSPFVRFALQVVIASSLVWTGLVITHIDVGGRMATLGWTAPIVSVLFLVWMANLYNFMDGMDGLAGSMAFVGFLFAAAVAGGDPAYRAVCVAVAAAAAGFLTRNLPPAALFMGDVGSIPLGFLAGALAVRAAQDQPFNLYVFLLIFSPFFVDATIVLVRRLMRREPVWRAHRTHAYQRLILAGWSVPQTLAAEVATMALCGATALVALRASGNVRSVVFAVWAAVYAALYFLVGKVERRSPIRG